MFIRPIPIKTANIDCVQITVLNKVKKTFSNTQVSIK